MAYKNITQHRHTASGWKFANEDFEGYGNWDTREVMLILDNTAQFQRIKQQMAEQKWTPDQIRDWAITSIIGPTNAKLIQNAQEYMEENPNTPAMENPDRELGIIDQEKVNWQEVYDEVNNEYAEHLQSQEQNASDTQPGDLTFPADWWTKGSSWIFAKKTNIIHHNDGKEEHWDNAKQEWVIYKNNKLKMPAALGPKLKGDSEDEDRHHNVEISNNSPGVPTVGA